MTEHIRLTNYIRDAIIKTLMEKRFKKQLAEFHAKEVELGLRVYQSVYPDWKIASKLSEGWLCSDTCVRFRMDGQSHMLPIGKSMPTPYGSKTRNLPQEMTKEVRDLKREEEALDALRNSARDQAKSLLYSVQTLKRLLETWPEVKPYLPKDLEQPVTALAVPVSQLNQVFGLVK